jgi:hypothetical protein
VKEELAVGLVGRKNDIFQPNKETTDSLNLILFLTPYKNEFNTRYQRGQEKDQI